MICGWEVGGWGSDKHVFWLGISQQPLRSNDIVGNSRKKGRFSKKILNKPEQKLPKEEPRNGSDEREKKLRNLTIVRSEGTSQPPHIKRGKLCSKQ